MSAPATVDAEDAVVASLRTAPLDFTLSARGGCLPEHIGDLYQPGHAFCEQAITYTSPIRHVELPGNTVYLIGSRRGRQLQPPFGQPYDQPIAFYPGTWFVSLQRTREPDGTWVIVLADCGSLRDQHTPTPLPLRPNRVAATNIAITAGTYLRFWRERVPGSRHIEPDRYDGPFGPPVGAPHCDPHQVARELDLDSQRERERLAVLRLANDQATTVTALFAEGYTCYTHADARVIAPPHDRTDLAAYIVVDDHVHVFDPRSTPADVAYLRAIGVH